MFIKFNTKVFYIVFLIILMLGAKPFFAFSSVKNDSTNMGFCPTTNHFCSDEEDWTSQNYSTFMRKNLSPFTLNQYHPKKDLSYSKELLSFFPHHENNQLYFHGYAEYAHFLTVSKIDFTMPKVNIILDGSMMDGYNLGKRELNVKYIVNGDGVDELITVKHENKKESNTLNSIIPNQTILKLPLKVDNSWSQKFFYEDIEYEAIRTITSIKTENNITRCTTTTTVNNINGYLNDTYIEERTYEQGKGLVYFSVSTPLGDSFPYVVFENNTFSYILDQYIEK